ncbi:hypothetical protein [Streptomyces dioscori]|uniref:hypothetical protein n=1 Tax=Streptomyces dioscori TaxID=2109333 RepID=UPI00131B376A|nr:hypothetical protein [Streptomyces dioscori]
MADERSVFPGDDPTPPGRWLDRDAAERLLRGEPLEAVDADIRAQADRLAEALDELRTSAAGFAPTGATGVAGAAGAASAAGAAGERGAELPGEEAALAAFRSARSGRSAETALAGPSRRRSPASFPSTPSATSATSATSSSPFSPSSSLGASLDAGLVRLGRFTPDDRARSPWSRPVRYGLAAALAAGMIGGVAVAATAGVLAFGGGGPEPGASATADVTQDRPLRTPSPEATRRGDDPRPEGSAGAPTGGDSAPSGEAPGGTGTGARPDSDDTGRESRQGQRWARIASACRDIRDGKDLDAGRRRTLEDAARGAEQVQKYCRGVLRTWNHRDSDDDWNDPGSGYSDPDKGDDGKGDNGFGGGKGDDRGGDDNGFGGGHGDGKGDGGGPDGDDRGHMNTSTSTNTNTNTSTFRSDEGKASPARSARVWRPGVTFSAAPTQY